MNVKRGPGSDTERRIRQAATTFRAEGIKGESVERGLHQGYCPWLKRRATQSGHSDFRGSSSQRLTLE